MFQLWESLAISEKASIYKLFFAKAKMLIWLLTSFGAAGLIWLVFLGQQSPGEGKQIHISHLIRSSALTYLNEQYKVIIGIVTLVSIPVLYFFRKDGLSFIIGIIITAAFSALSIIISTLINIRTLEITKKSVSSAFYFVLACCTALSLFFVSSSVLAVLLTTYFGRDMKYLGTDMKYILLCLCFGTSLVSIFTRLGGGIFTKGADVGADMVGKIEKNMNEDDARNPAVIADNVGDNVGDGSGTTADLIETIVISLSSSILLINNYYNYFDIMYQIFLLLTGSCLSAVISFICIKFFEKKDSLDDFDPDKAVRKFNSLTCFFLIVIGSLAAWKFDLSYKNLYCFLIGILCAFANIKITEYYTSTQYSPVQEIYNSSKYGHGSNVITGLAIGLESVFPSVIVAAIGAILCIHLNNILGIVFGAIGVISWAATVLSQDLIGPIVDNAGGIAVMANLPSIIRDRTDKLDIVGNTTKAIAKGYTLISALFTCILMYYYFEDKFICSLEISSISSNSRLFSIFGLLFGITLPMIFSTFALRAVGRAAQSVVEEIRNQLSNPLILSGEIEPDYKRTIVTLTRQSIKAMIFPSFLPILFPGVVFLIFLLCFGKIAAPLVLGNILIANSFSGSIQSIFMITSGGAWDNAKKLVESKGEKNTPVYQHAVTGDTVGDPFKDTAGPALNSLIKLTNIASILIVIIYQKYS